MAGLRGTPTEAHSPGQNYSKNSTSGHVLSNKGLYKSMQYVRVSTGGKF